jgi:hypothetical protein
MKNNKKQLKKQKIVGPDVDCWFVKCTIRTDYPISEEIEFEEPLSTAGINEVIAQAIAAFHADYLLPEVHCIDPKTGEGLIAVQLEAAVKDDGEPIWTNFSVSISEALVEGRNYNSLLDTLATKAKARLVEALKDLHLESARK